MKEYIEREAVLNDIAELFTLCHETLPNECGHHFIVENELKTHLDFVKNLPAADVREVVLCRDCKYFNCQDSTTDGKSRCDREQLYQPISYRPYRKQDDFCSCGEKREES